MLQRLGVFLLLLPLYLLHGQEPVRLQEPRVLEVPKDIRVKEYFRFMDSLLTSFPDTLSPKVTEHVLLWHNPWIMDSLVNTDYYLQKARGIFNADQKENVVLPKGSRIEVPDSDLAKAITHRMENVILDINIPEFALRVYEGDLVKETFPIRVGRREHKYLQMAGRVTDLRTIPGNGKIVRVISNPDYYNPVTGQRYYVTKRDDGKVTRMPQIPWFETEINGVRNGQMIHPTTNPETLGRAYSNGCIGLSEADAWRVYFYARVGTPLRIRYDLFNIDEKGDTLYFSDIYKLKRK